MRPFRRRAWLWRAPCQTSPRLGQLLCLRAFSLPFSFHLFSVSERAHSPKTDEKRMVRRKLEGKVAVLTAATSGMALATAKLFVETGAYVFITGRRKDKLDEAVKPSNPADRLTA